MYKLVVYVPEKSIENVKTALFKAGAGRLGNYDCCSWQVPGLGQFRPLAGSRPDTGEIGVLETVSEWRLDVLVDEPAASDVKKALLESHPYEEPAFEFLQCIDVD